MEHIAALLLVIGCSGDLTQCSELPAPVALYETAEECDQARPPVLAAFTNAKPRIFAQCVEIDPALAEEDLELTWDVTSEHGLQASIGLPELQIATNFRRPEKDYLSHE